MEEIKNLIDRKEELEKRIHSLAKKLFVEHNQEFLNNPTKGLGYRDLDHFVADAHGFGYVVLPKAIGELMPESLKAHTNSVGVGDGIGEALRDASLTVDGELAEDDVLMEVGEYAVLWDEAHSGGHIWKLYVPRAIGKGEEVSFVNRPETEEIVDAIKRIDDGYSMYVVESRDNYGNYSILFEVMGRI